MKRKLLHSPVVGLVSLPLAPALGSAGYYSVAMTTPQTYPTKTVRLAVPFAEGARPDTLAAGPLAGISIVHIPYKGSPPALIDALGGRVVEEAIP